MNFDDPWQDFKVAKYVKNGPVQDRSLLNINMDGVICDLSNSAISNDLGWPNPSFNVTVLFTGECLKHFINQSVNQSVNQWRLFQATKAHITDKQYNKKAVLSQRWPRDARYISRSWAFEEIWPFQIIQDGGGRHLEFVRIENSAIRSAVPENPTL